MKRILAAVDLGPDTERILAYALWLDRTFGARDSITLLNVMDYALTPPAYLQSYIEKEKARNEESLRQWEERLRSHGAQADHVIAAGRLVETFSAAMRELHTDMLVLGYKSHVIKPSSSERLIKSLAVPMLVVRGQKSEGATLGSIKATKILCAVDFSDNSKKALEFALTLSQSSSSHLTVINAVSSVDMEKSFKSLKGMSEKDRADYKTHLVREAEERMCSFLDVCSSADRRVSIGDPYKVINDAAAEAASDLIIMGARGLSYTKGVLLGSVSESVIKSSPCPVAIVH